MWVKDTNRERNGDSSGMGGHYDKRCERTRCWEVVFREFDVVVEAFIQFLSMERKVNARRKYHHPGGTHIINQRQPG